MKWLITKCFNVQCLVEATDDGGCILAWGYSTKKEKWGFSFGRVRLSKTATRMLGEGLVALANGDEVYDQDEGYKSL